MVVQVTRLHIDIDTELDDALTIAAKQRRTTKAALVRQMVAAQYTPTAPQRNALMRMAGMLDGASDDSRSVDDVVHAGR